MKIVKALSVKRPWSEMIALGEKPDEVRSWTTSYRGPLLICTSTNVNAEACEALEVDVDKAGRFRGRACCLVELAEIKQATFSRYEETAMCDVEAGDYLWRLVNPRRVAAVKIRGRLRLFDVDAALIQPLDGPRAVMRIAPDYPTCNACGNPRRGAHPPEECIRQGGRHLRGYDAPEDPPSFLDRMRVTPKL